MTLYHFQLDIKSKIMEKILGIDKSLYKIIGIKNKKKVGTIKIIAHTKLEAYYGCKHLLPVHNKFDYEHIRFANDDEQCGVIIEKNDIKRKK